MLTQGITEISIGTLFIQIVNMLLLLTQVINTFLFVFIARFIYKIYKKM
ncbi:MAG: hypothetical protein KAH05_08370 [Clostridiales bacterium]|nr:hypothetical protein [Clostridiales bacterium]